MFHKLSKVVLMIVIGLQFSVSASEDRENALVTYADIVYANYSDAHADAFELQTAVNTLLANPSKGKLRKARKAWLVSRESYGQTEVYRFYGGPIDGIGAEAGWPDGVEGPEGRLNAWPLNEAFIDYVAGNAQAGIVNDSTIAITTEGLIVLNGVSDEADVTTGYHAIEFLLWGQDLSLKGPGNRPVDDYTGDSGTVLRRKAYLKSVTDLLVDNLASLVDAWNPANSNNFRAKFLAQDVDVALGQIMIGMATLSGFELASERIAVALDSGDQEDEHSCFSDNTHRDFVMNAQGIQNVLQGRYGKVKGVGIVDLVHATLPSLANTLGAINARTVVLAGKVSSPVDRILASPENDALRTPLEDLVEALYTQAEMLVEAGKVLGVKVVIAGE